MKKAAIVFFLFTVISTVGIAQDDTAKPSENQNHFIFYTGFFNLVPDGFDFPLLGFVNIHKGSHQGVQIGYVNINLKDFSGMQAAFINYSGGNVKGVQGGFINTTLGTYNGVQAGFINSSLKSHKGVQLGYVNTSLKEFEGIQLGFVNNAIGGQTKGAQLGFVNTSAAKHTQGTQIGFVNLASKIKGYQIGFVNIADEYESGIPLGFLSIVRKGGYQAVEISTNEIAPLNASYKIGIQKFYTSILFSYNPEATKPVSTGFGMGSIMSVSPSLIFNPELNLLNTVEGTSQNFNSVSFCLGYYWLPQLVLIAGPSLSFMRTEKDRPMNQPFFRLSDYDFSTNRKFVLGARAGLRLQLSTKKRNDII